MTDFEITLDNEESMKVYAYEGKKGIQIFLWKKNEHHFDIAISVEGIEKKVIVINHHGEDIEIFDGYSELSECNCCSVANKQIKQT